MGARAQGGHHSWARAEAACAPAVASSWQVSSFSEARAQQILQQKPARYLCFNQNQLSRVYPSSYRVDSSNFNPQPFWNAGCQMGGCRGVAVLTRGFGEPPVASSRLGLGVGVPQDPRARWELRRVCHACPGVRGGPALPGTAGHVARMHGPAMFSCEPQALLTQAPRGLCRGGRGHGRMLTGSPHVPPRSGPELPVGGADAAVEPGQVQCQRQLWLRAQAPVHVPG